MGVTINGVKLLFYAQRQGAKFSKTLMLGRQQLFVKRKEAERIQQKFGIPSHNLSGEFAEPLFKVLGADTVDSMDYSDFEKATIIHDLNRPVGSQWETKFSVVFDGGTLEHVFNFPVAIKNCMDMLCVGGHFISLTPSNNYCGHGFYQFSPELFFAIFNETHGFKIKLIALGVEQPLKGIEEWFEVKDPANVKGRVTVRNSFPTSLLIIAEKIKDTRTMELHPFQSDYSRTWTIHESKGQLLKEEHKWIHYYRRWAPAFLKNIIRRVIGFSGKQKNVEGLGMVNPEFFTKMDI